MSSFQVIVKVLTLSSVLFLISCNHEEKISLCDLNIKAEHYNPYFMQNTDNNLAYDVKGQRFISLSCHNCYDEKNETYIGTTNLIQQAIDQGANAIELDIIFVEKNELPNVLISHDVDGTGISFKDLIEEDLVASSTLPLMIEIKGDEVNIESVELLLDILIKQTDNSGTYQYFNQNRQTIIRSAMDLSFLAKIQNLILSPKYDSIRPYIKISKIHFRNQYSYNEETVYEAYHCGMQMVEFDIRIGRNKINRMAKVAKELDLSVALFTLDKSNYATTLNNLPSHIHLLTIEGDRRFKVDEQTEHSIYQEIRKLLSFSL